MATGDILVFDQFLVDLGNKVHDLDSDTWKFALITESVTPSVSDVAPHFGGTGTTDYSEEEVTPGGNYPEDGVSLTSLSYSNTGGVASWNANKVSIAVDGDNPTNARWAIIYNSTDSNKRAAMYVDLGDNRDLSAGLFEFQFNSIDGTGTIATISRT